MRGLIVASLLPLLASAAPTFSTETIHEGVAPLLTSSNSEEVPDSYIVVFKKHVTEASASHHHSWVQDIHLESETQRTELRKRSQFPITDNIFEGLKHTYNIAGNFLGYSGHFDDEVIEKVRRHPDVRSSPNSLLPFPSFSHQNRMPEHALFSYLACRTSHRYLCTLGCLSCRARKPQLAT
jgi:cerevisin